MKQTFKAKLTSRGPGGAWTFLEVPFSVEQAFGTRARVAVAGTINGFSYRNSLMPQGDGTHAMMVGKDLQAGASAHAGDSVTVVMDIDRSERVVEVPVELKRALAASKPAAKMFESLSYSHRKEFADWVGSAKQADTRLARAAKAVPLVLARKHCR